MNVVITGAGGRTGRIAYRRMKDWPEKFNVRGVVRTLRSSERIGGTDDVFVGDVAKFEDLPQAFSGLDALIILTSSIPKLKPNLNPSIGRRPDFYFDEGGYPEQVRLREVLPALEVGDSKLLLAMTFRCWQSWLSTLTRQVDWIGQVNQIEAAKSNDVQHIVLISSLGGKYPDHPLNVLGDGKILIWKRKAEEYLRDSGVPYTIIRAGYLENAEGGRREILTGRDDELLHSMYRKIPRADLAEVAIQALLIKESQFKTFDLVSKPEGEGSVTTDFKLLFSLVDTPF